MRRYFCSNMSTHIFIFFNKIYRILWWYVRNMNSPIYIICNLQISKNRCSFRYRWITRKSFICRKITFMSNSIICKTRIFRMINNRNVKEFDLNYQGTPIYARETNIADPSALSFDTGTFNQKHLRRKTWNCFKYC